MWTGYVYLTLKTQHPEATRPFPLFPGVRVYVRKKLCLNARPADFHPILSGDCLVSQENPFSGTFPIVWPSGIACLSC